MDRAALMDLGVIFFVAICGIFVVLGFAALLNIFGAADHMAAQNRERRDEPLHEPGHRPESRRGMRLWGLGAMVSGVVGIVSIMSDLSGDTTTSCAYKGAPARVLTVTVGDRVAEIRRRGTHIEVREQGEGLARCSGETPTVRNTDTMRIVIAEASFVDLDLSGGAFAPGATPEPEGASEIEIELSLDLAGTAYVYGTSGDDEWHWGPGGANPALNVNPGEAGDRDVDVRISGREEAYGALIANGGGGDDTIIGAPDARVRGQLIAFGHAGDDLLSTPAMSGEREFGAELHGGPGDDTISGDAHDDELAGDAGNDRIGGRAGADRITAGRGRDRISGGAGRDTVNARDGVSEAVSCGADRDRARVDTFDELRDCEQVAPR